MSTERISQRNPAHLGAPVDAEARQHRLELLTDRSAASGLPVTAQRRAVLETILDMNNHPSADQVHAAVLAKMPEVSRATVYRSLDTLVDFGLLVRLCHPGRVARFDPRTSAHHHLICLRCDAVRDFEDERLNQIDPPDTSSHGFALQDLRVQLRGVCSACLEKENTT
ncbi:transcriptional repressor [bacterium]|nr:MAG: transcriptional repressor [bacterium]